MIDRVYITVASFCLVEAIEKLKEDGCVELGLSKQDGSWLLSFNLPCKKMSVVTSDDELLPEESRPPVELFPDAEQQVHKLYKQENPQ